MSTTKDIINNHPLKPGELLNHKIEHDINQNLNRISDSVTEFREKIEVPMAKVKSAQRTLQSIPWGLIATGTAFTIGFLVMKNKRRYK